MCQNNFDLVVEVSKASFANRVLIEFVAVQLVHTGRMGPYDH